MNHILFLRTPVSETAVTYKLTCAERNYASHLLKQFYEIINKVSKSHDTHSLQPNIYFIHVVHI
jgi:hypothetical protein